jgi:hypothetical protein
VPECIALVAPVERRLDRMALTRAYGANGRPARETERALAPLELWFS